MSGFADLKRSGSNFDKLVERLEKSSQTFAQDNRFWKAEMDKSGNGYAVIRFLPAPNGEDYHFVNTFKHTFEINGKWYIENCPTTIGKKCPVCDHNSALWNSGIDANKKIVSNKTKRKLVYYSNVYVIKDTLHPENEGKVFLFNYGKKIQDKINSKIKPEFPDEKPLNPFDFWKGCDFKLKIRKVEGYANYDKSEFDVSRPIFLDASGNPDEAKMEQVWNKCNSLVEFIDPSKFKSYEELQERFNKVMGSEVQPVQQEQSRPAPKRASVAESAKTVGNAPAPTGESEDMQDALNYFNTLNKDE